MYSNYHQLYGKPTLQTTQSWNFVYFELNFYNPLAWLKRSEQTLWGNAVSLDRVSSTFEFRAGIQIKVQLGPLADQKCIRYSSSF